MIILQIILLSINILTPTKNFIAKNITSAQNEPGFKFEISFFGTGVFSNSITEACDDIYRNNQYVSSLIDCV